MKLLKSFKAWVKSHDTNLYSLSPEAIYQAKEKERSDLEVEEYILKLVDYLLFYGLKGKIKIPRTVSHSYIKPQVYCGVEIIWGNK